MPGPDESRITRIRDRTVYAEPDNPFVSVHYDDVEWPDGRRGRYNRIVEGGGHSGVVILPILTSGVGLVLMDRYPVNRRVWEAPRGFGESDDPVVDAHRELGEETGWRAAEMHDLGSVFLNSGLLAGKVQVFAARIDESQERVSTDGEAVDLQVVSIPRLKYMLVRGQLPDAPTHAAVLLASCHGLIPPFAD